MRFFIRGSEIEHQITVFWLAGSTELKLHKPKRN